MHDRYPSIFPKVGFRRYILLNCLFKKYPYAVVVRRSEVENPFTISADGRRGPLKPDALGQNVTELSVNLLGGYFRLKHLPFSPKLEYVNSNWNGVDIINEPVESSMYDIKDKYPPIFFRIADVNNTTFPYAKEIKEKVDYTVLKKAGERYTKTKEELVGEEIIGAFQALENKKTQVHGRMMINHRPNLLNYWHMHIDAYTAIGENVLIKHGDNFGEAKQVRRNMKARLLKKAIMKLKPGLCYRIDKKYFLKKSTIVQTIIDFIVGKWNLMRLTYSKYRLE